MNKQINPSNPNETDLTELPQNSEETAVASSQSASNVEFPLNDVLDEWEARLDAGTATEEDLELLEMGELFLQVLALSED